MTGLLLAGIGVGFSKPVQLVGQTIEKILICFQHVTQPPDAQKNFFVVDTKTETPVIEQAFETFTQKRNDIAILLINQHVCSSSPATVNVNIWLTLIKIAEKIRSRVDNYTEAFPALLEIPSKDHPYDPEKDSVLKRVRRLFGE